MSPPATTACAIFERPAIAASAIPSPTAPTAAPATPSRARSLMTGRSPPWPASPCASNACANTKIPSIGASTRSPTPARIADRRSLLSATRRRREQSLSSRSARILREAIGQRAGRISSGLRSLQRRSRPIAARTQEAQRQTVRADGPRRRRCRAFCFVSEAERAALTSHSPPDRHSAAASGRPDFRSSRARQQHPRRDASLHAAASSAFATPTLPDFPRWS